MSDTVVLEPAAKACGRGDIIAGKYRLEHELGRGGMGTVWAACHTTLGQRVAIKLIAIEHARLPEARHRFSLEAKAAARLKSRHAVQVYDDGETPEGIPYIVMEYLEGETLEARLERQHDIGLAEAVRITMHVGRALARAHARSIVHRDLKSGNVFIARTDDDEHGWVAKVLDFGVAKLADLGSASTTKTGTIVGTPLFMAPEQVRGASTVDHRADLYSLGMVFYNMVTGDHAFNGPSYSDVLVAICTERLPEIRIKAPWLPEPVAAWFNKACAREPDDRFQSADEMLEALRDAAGAQGRMSRPSIPDEVGGPSGTIVGHVPPHVATRIGPAPEGLPSERSSAPPRSPVPSPNDRTLRSRTGPRSPAPERPDSVGVIPMRHPKLGYMPLALAGAGAALVLVLLVLLVTRETSEPPTAPEAVSDTPAAPRAALAPAPSPPLAAPLETPPPTREPAPPSPEPSEEEERPKPEPPAAKPVARPSRNVANTRLPAPEASAEGAPVPAVEPRAPRAAPDMGF